PVGGMHQETFDPADVTLDYNRVGLERLLCWAVQHIAGADVELRTVPQARHGLSVEAAFLQLALHVGAPRLRGAEPAVVVEHDVLPTCGIDPGSTSLMRNSLSFMAGAPR